MLADGTTGAQMAVLQQIAQDPGRAVRLGPHGGEDLVDLLIRLLAHSVGSIRQLQLICLMCFDDPRALAWLAGEFSRSSDAASVLHLGKRLAAEKGAGFFRPFLWHESAAQGLAAARVCSLEGDLTAREQLRVALLLDEPYAPPALSERHLDLWLEELAGRHRPRVRQLAESQGEGLLLLWSRYSALAVAERDWLLRWTADRFPAFLRQQLPGLLREPAVSLTAVQLAFELDLPLGAQLFGHADERVRSLAVAQGLADDRLEDCLEASLPEALAACARLSTPGLLGRLADARWEVRSAATRLLAQRADLPLDEVRRRAAEGALEQRVAAVELLRRRGDTAWLETNL